LEKQEARVREELRKLRESIATTSGIAKKIDGMIEENPEWAIEFSYKIGEHIYNMDLNSLTSGKINAVYQKEA